MATAPLAAAASVAERLRDRSTRLATLGALEAHAVPIPADDALAAAPALFELLALDAAEVPHELYDRAGLLAGRLVNEAVPRGAEAQAAVLGAAWGGGRYARFLNAEGSVLAVALRKLAAELTRADARSYACSVALSAPAMSRGYTAPIKAAGFATMAWFGLVSPHRARRLLFSVCTFTLKSRPHLIARAVDGRRPDRLPEEKAER